LVFPAVFGLSCSFWSFFVVFRFESLSLVFMCPLSLSLSCSQFRRVVQYQGHLYDRPVNHEKLDADLKAVDEKAFGDHSPVMASYLEVLRKLDLYPMDLGTVLQKLQGANPYATADEWYEDVEMTFRAARGFWMTWIELHNTGGMSPHPQLKSLITDAYSIKEGAEELTVWVDKAVAKSKNFRFLDEAESMDC
jgi:hypothetical protein